MGTFYPTYLSVKQLKRKVEEGEVKNDESKKGDGFDGDLSFNRIYWGCVYCKIYF